LEKERNISLAERIIEKERQLQDLQIKVTQLTNLAKDERLSESAIGNRQTAKGIQGNLGNHRGRWHSTIAV